MATKAKKKSGKRRSAKKGSKKVSGFAKKAKSAIKKAEKALKVAETMMAQNKLGASYGTKMSDAIHSKAVVQSLNAGAARLKRLSAKKPKRVGKKRKSSKGSNTQVTAAQVVAMAKKGKLQRWLCQAPKRSGCGRRARVVSGKGSFQRLRGSPRRLAA